VVCANQGLASLGCVEGECSCGVPPQCDDGETHCQGANTVAICTDGQWVPTSCIVQCAEAGLASAGCVGSACSCTDSPPECDEGAMSCETAEVYAQCVAGTWKATPCAEVCDAQGKDSHGCLGQSCQCVEKPLCYVGDTQCAGSTSLAVCNGASWDLASCADVCASTGMVGNQCVGESCACSPAPDCSEGQEACDGATRLTCVGSSWVSTPCATVCAGLGLVGGQCADGSCACLGDQAPACAGCLSGGCAIQAQACRGSAPCAALTACLTGCGADSACKSTCWSSNPTGMPGLSALLDCVATSCAGACPDLPTCLQGQMRCASSNASEACQGGQWIVSNCSEACYAQGLKSAGCSGGACSCVYSPFECEHGAGGCPSAQTAATCQYGVWGPQTSCPSACAAEGKVSQGCSAGACQCEVPCTVGQTRCQDATTLQSCDVPPTWSPHVCESECTLQGLVNLGCSTTGGAAACHCVTLCGACVFQQCGAAAAACDATQCEAWAACDNQCWLDSWSCGEYSYECYAACTQGCTAAYPGAYEAWVARSDCQWNTCGYVCN
jgi:hypothetical protein